MKWLVIVLFMVPAYAQTLNVVENEFVKIVTGPEGFDHPRFSIETTGGDPSRDNDNDMPLIYGRPKPWTSYTSIAVDNEVFGFGTQTLKRAGKSARYGQVVSSVVTNNAMTTTTQLGDVFATQTLSLFRNPLTNVKDSVLIEYEVMNQSTVTKDIGLRIMMDTMLGKNDAAPFRIGQDAIVSEKTYKGKDVLDYWQTFDSLVSPNVIAQGMLRYAPASLTPPDELILMNWGSLADAPFKVDVTPGRSFIREGEDEPDTAVALMYNQRPLAPNETRVYRTIMGVGGLTMAPGDLALGLTFPSVIAITDPNAYAMVVYIANTGGFDVQKAEFRLTLPDGLVIQSGQAVESLGTILANGDRQLLFTIRMNPKAATEGTKTIQIKVISDTLAPQVLRREVVFSAQPKLSVAPVGRPTLKKGLDQYVDVPIEVSNASVVPISSIQLTLEVPNALKVPDFETPTKAISVLDPNASQQVSWKVKVSNWHGGTHHATANISSEYTSEMPIALPIDVTLGAPKARLYYSEPSVDVSDYGYVWITLLDMPTFSGLNLTMTWDDTLLKPIRVSPEPWLLEANPNAMAMFDVTSNAMQITNMAAEAPPWRMIICKWHFKAVDEGDAVIRLWQGDQVLDELTIVNTLKETLNDKEDDQFDF
jgi:hypothetical protein